MSDSLAFAPVTKVERNSLKMGKIPFTDRIYIYIYSRIYSRCRGKKYLKLRPNLFQLYSSRIKVSLFESNLSFKKQKKYLERSRQTNWQNKLVHIRSIDTYLNLSFSSKHSIVIVSIIVQRLWAHG